MNNKLKFIVVVPRKFPNLRQAQSSMELSDSLFKTKLKKARLLVGVLA